MPPLHDAGFIALQEALAGEYSLDRELGRGGMGIVYLAREVRLARPVAIKVLPPALAADATIRAAFLRESQVIARLSHPNIVPVFAAGERDGFVYIAMAFVEGTTLGERIRSRGPLLPGQAARVLREVAWALAYAHGAGIVHRDVSAENILLERGTERAIVTDFGIAGAMRTSALTDDGTVLGNAHYVSPEHIAGQPVEAPADLYSLGVTGYYALTGRLPFDGETSADVIRKQLTETAPSITSVAPAVPPRLASAVERCLHKEPFRRYRNAESFAEAIDLAFEHAREIPAPLRVFLNKGDQETPALLAFFGMGAMPGIALAIAMGRWEMFFVPFAPIVLLGFQPGFFRLRNLLADGYVVDDIHAAKRERLLARSEEIEYERRQSSPKFRRLMRILFGASLGAAGLGLGIGIDIGTVESAHMLGIGTVMMMQRQLVALLFPALCGATIGGVALAGEFVRLRLAGRLAAASISFWKGKWGARLAKLASIGLKPPARPVLGMPMLTEIALGRATDHLFDALPKTTRRELAELPGIVRKLEQDAGALRVTIGKLDDQLAAFEFGTGAIDDAERSDVADSLRVTRATAAERLSATVTALEGIRLDLLRLQMGTAGVESVTASLQAATEMANQIAGSLDAQQEVERLLRRVESAPLPDAGADRASGDAGSLDDEDTPVGGVPAARG